MRTLPLLAAALLASACSPADAGPAAPSFTARQGTGMVGSGNRSAENGPGTDTLTATGPGETPEITEVPPGTPEPGPGGAAPAR